MSIHDLTARGRLILVFYMCERSNPVFRGQGKIAYICENSVHCSYKHMPIDGIYVTFICIDFELEVLQMYPISVSYSSRQNLVLVFSQYPLH